MIRGEPPDVGPDRVGGGRLPNEGFRRRWWGVAVVLCAGVLPALFGAEAIGRASALHGLASAPHPYLQPSHAGLLYGIAPLVAASSFLLFLAPGAVLALAFGSVRGAAELVVLAFGWSLALCVALDAGAKLVLGTAPGRWALLSLWLGSALLGWLLLAWRAEGRAALMALRLERTDGRRLLAIGVAWLLGVGALAPKLFWENFNLDGIEAFEFGRSLATHVLPRWEMQPGVFGTYANFVLFAWPNHWFIQLFGPLEAAARLPFLLYVGVLFAAIVLLVEEGGRRRLSGAEDALVWLGLLVYCVVQVYDTGYEPFFADVAETAATDTLQVVCFLVACHALWAGRNARFGAFGIMTYLAAPGGLLLLGALGVATLLVGSPRRRERAQLSGALLVGCVLLQLASDVLYGPLVLGGVENQFSGFNLIRRLYPPTLTELARWNALVFPSGLLPALSLLALRRADAESRVAALTALTVFGVLYVQAWASLHQFTPVMVLPLVVFWRLVLRAEPRLRRWLLPALAVSTVVALVLSLPQHFQVNHAARDFGRATDYRVGDYQRSYEEAMRAGWTLAELLPSGYWLDYPEQPWSTDAPSWIYYASRKKPPGTRIHYVVQPSSEPSPEGAVEVANRDGVALYVRDPEAWRRDRQLELPRVVVSPLYEPILRRTIAFFRDYTMRGREAEAGP